MSISVLRTSDGWWVQTPSGAAEIDTAATTTAQLLADRAAIETAAAAGHTIPVETLDLISPVTAPCRVVAQMTNFVSHVKDSGMNPDTVPLTFFRKSSGSISGPYDDVIKPGHVLFLDYEVEIGLVFGRSVPVGTAIDGDNVADVVAGLVVTNDVSARDIQLPKTQFYEAKSYPTFTPVGPALVLLEAGEFKRFEDLRLTLRVNGVVRQDMTVSDMIYRPVEALQALTRFQRLDAGDLLLTGTPGGTALKAPAKPIEILGSLLPPAVKWKNFFASQSKNPKYLQDGDVVELSVATDDGALDLGIQRTVVRYAR
ncbi:fumarylacetoacetate hydrolase family protein [Rhodococcus opacus]|uniref:fumarylacetoacetate hydrolase family protein n=1 Tax=Rhodococcus opacus TaxID=37919 RepID=UPI001C4834C6|nr:fumarylacetoacetate hydrolase family protein [Rhodococcus opacus]MBV6761641.1 fumarylacetoacetate hydrolase family protein [Rhodococcus opacus]